MKMKFQAPLDAKVLPFGQPRTAEEVAVNRELAEFKNDPELMLDKHQRWYLNMIACEATKSYQRRQARKMLDETVWKFSSKCLGLPPTRKGDERVVITISYETDTVTAVSYDRK